jgi:hypothetical protein
MDVLLVPRAELRQVLVDLETFLDLGTWGYLYQAIGQIEEMLGDNDAITKKKGCYEFHLDDA